jgi:hypothetical protein
MVFDKLKFGLLIKIFILALGLAVPSSFNVLFFNCLAVGGLASNFLKKRNFWVFGLLFILMFWVWKINGWQISWFWLACFLVSASFWLTSFLKRNIKYFVLIFVLTFGYFLVAFKDGRAVRQLVKDEPVYEKYTNDMMGYLKVYYLIEQGKEFYSSYALTEKGHAFTNNYPGEIWGWKTPFLFYLWKLMLGADGRSIYWLFCLFVMTVPLLSFLIASQVFNKSLACFSSFLVWPYFLLPLKDITFIQVEWWGLVFFLAGFYFLLKKKHFWIWLFFLMAVFARELYLVHIGVLLGVFIFKKDKKRVLSILSVLLLIFVFYVFIHIPQVARFENLNSWQEWLRVKGEVSLLSFKTWPAVRNTLAFSSWNYLVFRLFPFRIVFLMSFLSLVWLWFKEKGLKYLLSLVCFFPFFMLQFRPGLITLHHDYWGIYFMPLALLFSPGILIVFKSLRKKDKSI